MVQGVAPEVEEAAFEEGSLVQEKQAQVQAQVQGQQGPLVERHTPPVPHHRGGEELAPQAEVREEQQAAVQQWTSMGRLWTGQGSSARRRWLVLK